MRHWCCVCPDSHVRHSRPIVSVVASPPWRSALIARGRHRAMPAAAPCAISMPVVLAGEGISNKVKDHGYEPSRLRNDAHRTVSIWRRHQDRACPWKRRPVPVRSRGEALPSRPPHRRQRLQRTSRHGAVAAIPSEVRSRPGKRAIGRGRQPTSMSD